MMCHVEFSVSCPNLERGEEEAVMCMTGNCEQLGNWEPIQVVRMVRETNQDTNRVLWKSELDLPDDTNIRYRYALCSFGANINCEDDQRVIIHRWETALRPRRLITAGATLCKEEELFGSYDGITHLDRGWLTAQSEIQLLIHGRPLNLQGSSTNGVAPFGFKVTARREKLVAIESEENTSPRKRMKNYKVLPVFLSVLNDDEYEPRLQPDHGRYFNTDDVVIYSVQTFNPESLSFKVEIFCQDSIGEDTNRMETMGVATILGRNIGCATRYVPVIDSDLDTLGTLEVYCSLIKPLQPNNMCNFEVSYSQYWNQARPCLEIGHRGMGRSLVDHSLLVNISATVNIPENTIKSLQEALKHGADFVEFDIHVTKDRVPVIGHDFQAALKPATDQGPSFNLEVPINYLNLSEIDHLKTGQCMTLEHSDGRLSPCPSSPSKAPVPKEMQQFPTLQFALEEVDPDLGFLVEVKYPMDIVEGDKEMPHEKIPLRRSLLVDAILDITLKYGANRRIILCAFDPFVCIMLRLKQNRYPVLYANFGPSERYQLYEGPLCTGIKVSSLLARSMGFLGLSSHSLDLLHDPGLAVACNKAGLVHFCWGEDNNDDDMQRILKDMPIQGMIHDSIGKFPENRYNIFKKEKLVNGTQQNAPSTSTD